LDRNRHGGATSHRRARDGCTLTHILDRDGEGSQNDPDELGDTDVARSRDQHEPSGHQTLKHGLLNAHPALGIPRREEQRPEENVKVEHDPDESEFQGAEKIEVRNVDMTRSRTDPKVFEITGREIFDITENRVLNNVVDERQQQLATVFECAVLIVEIVTGGQKIHPEANSPDKNGADKGDTHPSALCHDP
jgi:hypothetical protein